MDERVAAALIERLYAAGRGIFHHCAPQAQCRLLAQRTKSDVRSAVANRDKRALISCRLPLYGSEQTGTLHR